MISPSATGRGDYKPALKPDVVKLEVIPDHQNPGIPTVESTMLPLEEPCPAIEVMLGTVSIKISNDVDPKLLSQILKAVTGTCRRHHCRRRDLCDLWSYRYAEVH